MIKACIFDLDGVLVDTARYHYLAWRRLARELGFDFSEEQNEALKGVSRMASLDILLDAGGLRESFSPAGKAEMATRKNNWYVEMISRMTPGEILPGVERFLEEVRHTGLKIALGSASRNAPMILERTGIARFFDAVVDGGMVSAAKPDPQVFLLGAELTGTPPDECVVFEDAEAGIEAATRAGMRSVGVGASETLAHATLRIGGFEGFTVENLMERLK
uniref:Putative beta-phosphoglucomutase n=1 Tax=termite gut metagenome TaxID=433724 RepID=S0DDK1_9ZZZZ